MRGLLGVLGCGLALVGLGCGGSKPNPFSSGPLVDGTTPTKDLGPYNKPLSKVGQLSPVGKPHILYRRGPYGLARAPLVLVLDEHGQGPDVLLIYWRTTKPLPRKHHFAFTSVGVVPGSSGELLEGTPPGYSGLARPDCYFTVAYETLGFRPGQRHQFKLDVRRGSHDDDERLSRVIASVKLREVRSDEDGIGFEGTDDRRWRQLGCTPYGP